MEEKNLQPGEGKNLNSNNSQDKGPKSGSQEAKTTFTAEEVEAMKKQMQSDSEKGVQKIITEKKAYEKAMSELSTISDEPKKLVDLYEENPNAAKVILDTYYNGQDIESFKESIGYEEDFKNPETIKKMVSKEAERIAEEKEVNTKTQSFIDKLNLSGDELKAFEEALEDRKGLKSYKNSDIQKHLEKAYLEIADTEQLAEYKRNLVIGEATSKVSGKTTKTDAKNAKKVELDNELEGFMKKFNQL